MLKGIHPVIRQIISITFVIWIDYVKDKFVILVNLNYDIFVAWKTAKAKAYFPSWVEVKIPLSVFKTPSVLIGAESKVTKPLDNFPPSFLIPEKATLALPQLGLLGLIWNEKGWYRRFLRNYGSDDSTHHRYAIKPE